MLVEEPLVLDHDAGCIGETCKVCNDAFAAGDEVVLCPRCKQAHHASCWYDYGGCARRGCAQIVSSRPNDKERITDDDRAKEYVRPMPKWLVWGLSLAALVVVIGIPILQNTVFADKRPKLTIMIPALADEALISSAVADFGEQHPDFQIQVIGAPYGPDGSLYEQKLAILISARDAPDIFILPWAKFHLYAEQGFFVDLTEWLKNESHLVAHIPPDRLERGRVNDVQVGLPHPGRSAFFGVFRNTPHADLAAALLGHIVNSLPAEDDVVDEFRVGTYLPPMQMFPGF